MRLEGIAGSLGAEEIARFRMLGEVVLALD
jgi:hypothetical protein